MARTEGARHPPTPVGRTRPRGSRPFPHPWRQPQSRRDDPARRTAIDAGARRRAFGGPGKFLALQLYDALQPNPKLIVQLAPEDERILKGEQGRAQEVVKHWLASHQVLA